MASTSQQQQQQLLLEVIQKVEASLQPSIDDYAKNNKKNAGLDYLDTKNSLLLSYLIELTQYHQHMLLCSTKADNNNNSNNNNKQKESSYNRLVEMRTVLDKMRSLDKKLRYQIDKLLAYSNESSSSSFVSSPAVNTSTEDPLQFRPQPDEDDSDDDSSDDSDIAEKATKKQRKKSADDSDDVEEEEEEEEEEDEEDDIDSDLATARLTLLNAKEAKTKKSRNNNNDGDEEDTVYRAPRLTAVPYTHDTADREAVKAKRLARKMRASEVAQTLRLQLTDAPETEEQASATSTSSAAARQFVQYQSARTQFEEDNMIRLTVTRKERQTRKKLQREQASNLGAISDLGNLVRESSYHQHASSQQNDSDDDEADDMRHANSGKRQRQHSEQKKKKKRY